MPAELNASHTYCPLSEVTDEVKVRSPPLREKRAILGRRVGRQECAIHRLPVEGVVQWNLSKMVTV